ncbi:hypothetical protein JTB14_008400 [Gonioctena quinquepunctata]|nr:hypothetical protein JTB14_008400 [Gonioctena quinquepunctata]
MGIHSDKTSSKDLPKRNHDIRLVSDSMLGRQKPETGNASVVNNEGYDLEDLLSSLQRCVMTENYKNISMSQFQSEGKTQMTLFGQPSEDTKPVGDSVKDSFDQIKQRNGYLQILKDSIRIVDENNLPSALISNVDTLDLHDIEGMETDQEMAWNPIYRSKKHGNEYSMVLKETEGSELSTNCFIDVPDYGFYGPDGSYQEPF